ncbi:hypothetical protein EV189_0762 [Motilibacter rhizosphaerae]|uniref:WD40 repeat protein n=1 Tax=Motilibacter rhizosphaerae TaxID=598652 RepID=A0A4Q7NWY5_9ACTN|nr:hypothetical protein [Motilibacter rhizosphaerae]RZS91520.1 hypothetical protein EV189_0762 [Motilibacter rhizosphaerae]
MRRRTAGVSLTALAALAATLPASLPAARAADAPQLTVVGTQHPEGGGDGASLVSTSLPGGSPVRVADTVSSSLRATASHDGSTLLLADDGIDVVVSTATGATRRLDLPAASALALTPDGSRAWLSPEVDLEEKPHLLVDVDLATGTTTPAVFGSAGASSVAVSPDGTRVAWAAGGGVGIADPATGLSRDVPTTRAVQRVDFRAPATLVLTTCEDEGCRRTAVRDEAGNDLAPSASSVRAFGDTAAGVWLAVGDLPHATVELLPADGSAVIPVAAELPDGVAPLVALPAALPPVARAPLPVDVRPAYGVPWAPSPPLGTLAVDLSVRLEGPGSTTVGLQHQVGGEWRTVATAPVLGGVVHALVPGSRHTRIRVVNADGAPLAITTTRARAVLTLTAVRRGDRMVFRGTVAPARTGTVTLYRRAFRGGYADVAVLPVRHGRFSASLPVRPGASAWLVTGGVDRSHDAGTSAAVRIPS